MKTFFFRNLKNCEVTALSEKTDPIYRFWDSFIPIGMGEASPLDRWLEFEDLDFRTNAVTLRFFEKTFGTSLNKKNVWSTQ